MLVILHQFLWFGEINPILVFARYYCLWLFLFRATSIKFLGMYNGFIHCAFHEIASIFCDRFLPIFLNVLLILHKMQKKERKKEMKAKKIDSKPFGVKKFFDIVCSYDYTCGKLLLTERDLFDEKDCQGKQSLLGVEYMGETTRLKGFIHSRYENERDQLQLGRTTTWKFVTGDN